LLTNILFSEIFTTSEFMKNKIILSSICFFCCGGAYAFGYDSPEMESGVPDTFRALTNSQQMAIANTKPVLTSEKGVEYKDLKVNGVVLRMVHVPGGTFGMGAQVAQPPVTSYDVTFDSLEGPVHQVTLSPYWIGQTEVTQALWMAVMGQDGRCSVDSRHAGDVNVISDYSMQRLGICNVLFCGLQMRTLSPIFAKSNRNRKIKI
jgi:formylglycine-generating enzyme required for sulfatase activity